MKAPLSGIGVAGGDSPPPAPPLTSPPATPPPPLSSPPPLSQAASEGRLPPAPSASGDRDDADQFARRRCIVVPPPPSRFELQNRLLSEIHDCIVPNLLSPSPSPATVWVTPPSRHPRFNVFFVRNSSVPLPCAASESSKRRACPRCCVRGDGVE